MADKDDNEHAPSPVPSPRRRNQDMLSYECSYRTTEGILCEARAYESTRRFGHRVCDQHRCWVLLKNDDDDDDEMPRRYCGNMVVRRKLPDRQGERGESNTKRKCDKHKRSEAARARHSEKNRLHMRLKRHRRQHPPPPPPQPMSTRYDGPQFVMPADEPWAYYDDERANVTIRPPREEVRGKFQHLRSTIPGYQYSDEEEDFI